MGHPLDRLHVIQRDGQFALFNYETMSVVEVAEPLAEVARGLKAGIPLADLAKKLDLDLEDVAAAERALVKLASMAPADEQREADRPPSIYLNISNACNLRCVYCYANCGEYGSGPGVMDEKTAFQTVDRFHESFGRIGSLVFFGGEPLLRASMIPAVCDYALAKAAERKVPPPFFSIITNGTLLTPENMDLLEKYKFRATVSIDGPEEINDLLRPTTKGTGSFSKVAEGLKRMRAAGMRPNIEATFTAKHLNLGVTPKELLRFFRDEYGARRSTISPVASTPGDEIGIHDYFQKVIPLYREAARFSLESLNTDRPIVLLMINELLRQILSGKKKANDQFCYTKLGKWLFTVSAQGKVFPCQMMTDNAKFDMGTITDPKFTETKQFKDVQAVFASTDKRNKLQCSDCWARNACFMCIAGVEIETKQVERIPEHRCDLIRGLLEEVLVYVASIRGDSVKWDQFCRNFFSN